MEAESVNRCEGCGVDVDGALKYCPLCGGQLAAASGENGLYPDVHEKTQIDRRSFTDDLSIFLTLLFIGGAVTLNMIFWSGTPWFLAVAAPVLYVWILVRHTIMSETYVGAKVFLQIGGVMGMMLAFDYMGGLYGWSYEVIFPLLLVAAIVYIDFYAWIHKSLWRDNLVYAIFFVALGCAPLALYLTGLTHAFAPMLLSAVASGVTVLGLLRFTIRHLREELHKRFHI
jgi:hypothetical protein